MNFKNFKVFWLAPAMFHINTQRSRNISLPLRNPTHASFSLKFIMKITKKLKNTSVLLRKDQEYLTTGKNCFRSQKERYWKQVLAHLEISFTIQKM